MKKSAIALSALLIAGSTGLEALAAEFTADAVETRPGQQLRYGKLFVKDDLSRFEFQIRGNPVVQITDKNANITRFLSPLSRSYFEISRTPDAADDGDFASASPCPKAKNIKCVKDKEETLGGFKVEKYRISADKVKRPAYVWWEPTRKMALRREYLGGGVQQMIMHGVMPYDIGRKAENWEVIYLSPFGSYLRGSIQYDTDLGVAVMQNFPNGVSRSLNNINVKKLDDSLFKIPDNYKKVDAPKKPRGPFGPSRLEKFSGAPGAMPGNKAALPDFTPHKMPPMPEWVKKSHEKAMREQKEAMEKMNKPPVFKAPETPDWVKKAQKEADARMKAQAKKYGFGAPPWLEQGRAANNAGFGNAPGYWRAAPPRAQYRPGGPGYFNPAPYGYPPRPYYAPGFNPAPGFPGAQPAKQNQ